MEARKIFAENISALIKSQGLSQLDVARSLGVAETTVSAWVRGVKYPRADKMQQLADFFGVLISDLTHESGKKPDSSIVLTEEERKLVDLFRRVDKEHMPVVRAMIEAALKKI